VNAPEPWSLRRAVLAVPAAPAALDRDDCGPSAVARLTTRDLLALISSDPEPRAAEPHEADEFLAAFMRTKLA
jgi:hypothetical protein